jgi:hypothetical protein
VLRGASLVRDHPCVDVELDRHRVLGERDRRDGDAHPGGGEAEAKTTHPRHAMQRPWPRDGASWTGRHRSQGLVDGKTLLVTEEDYIDTDEVPPGGCRGQGKFETWDLPALKSGSITPQGTWETELNGMFTSGARPDSPSSVADLPRHIRPDVAPVAVPLGGDDGVQEPLRIVLREQRGAEVELAVLARQQGHVELPGPGLPGDR